LALTQTMANRVLNDRLQQHMRHENFGQPGLGDTHPQPVLEPDLLDGEVQPQEFELAPEWDYLGLNIIEREAQEIAQFFDHAFGLRRLVLLDQDHDGTKRIEQKMRL